MVQPATVHRFGGRTVWRQSYAWDGLALEVARWRVGADVGVTRPRDHLVFVTLDGSIGRTVARVEDGQGYSGADFPGAVSFIPSGRTRRASYDGGTITYAAIRLDPAGVGEDGEAFGGLDPGRVEFTGFTNRPDPLVHQMSLALWDSMNGPVGTLFAESAASTLLLHLVRRYSNVAGPPMSAPEEAGRLPPKALRDVLAYVHENLGEDLGLVRLTAIAGVGRHRLGRGFKAATGLTPHRYILERRIERAAELLRTRRDLSIADIAHLVGLSSQSHLTTVFRRRYGATPHAYRISFTA